MSQPTVAAAPLRAEIDLGALRRNVRRLQEHLGAARLAATVKADAYGHGVASVVEAFAAEGVDWFCVARLDEGIALREGGLHGRVLVLGAPFPDELDAYATRDLDLTVTSESVAATVVEDGPALQRSTGTSLRVHVKADTGMHRLGLPPDAVPATVARLRAAEGVAVEGLWTHFATADAAGSSFARTQLARFVQATQASAPLPPFVHVANSGAALLLDGALAARLALPAGTTALARLGGLLYGLPSSHDLAAGADRLGLEPVMRLVARVMHVHTVAAGETVSYGQTWTAAAPTRIATLAVGYGDGLPRALSNQGEVGIGGRRYPIAGRVCMDLTMLDLGPPDGPGAAVRPGDEAVLFGPGGPAALDVATAAGTLTYDLTAGVTARVPRRIVSS